tara:strand:+ start:36 stop:1487 length:1452 start_codon:yes stop_codon:yes gene_type:complete
MAIKPGMSIAEAILQLTRGFQKVMGRKPDGLEKIKIQQEAVQRLNELSKVVDMQGNVIDTSKGIMGGRQIQDNKEFGEALKKALMEKDNPYSDLVKTTEKGPKTLEQRRKEAQKALQNKNVVPIEGKILDKQIKQEFNKGMKEGKFKDVRLRDGREIKSEDDFREYIDELNEDSNFATGGRAGFDMGGAPSIVLNPDEREAGKVFETDKVEEAIKEIIKRSIGPLDMAEIPLTEKGRLRFGFDSSGDKQISGGLDLLGGELNFGAGEGKQGRGVGFEFKKRFADGGRIGLKDGMSRRKFMKIMGGLASLPFLGKFFKGAKPAAKVAEVATKTPVGQPPEYFFDLAAKIKILGKESKVSPGERIREIDYKNYSLQEDITTGDMTIVKRKGDPEFGYEEEVMSLRKGQADEMTKGKTPPDEYEELTVRPDGDGKMKDVEDGIEPEGIKEIMEEVKQGGGNLDQTTLEEIARGKLASGGVAMMLGE